MELSELFRITLVRYLNSQPRGAKSRLADDLSIDRTNLSAFFSGKDNFSEERRASIANYLGFEYTEFVDFGKKLLESDAPYFWALRSIYIDPQRFADLCSDSGVEAKDFEYQLRSRYNMKFPPDLLEKICQALIIKPEDFMETGRKEMIKNPKMQWDLWGEDVKEAMGKLKDVYDNLITPQVKEQVVSDLSQLKELLEGFEKRMESKLDNIKLTFENDLLREKAKHAEQMLEIFKELNSLKTICQTHQTQTPQPQQTKAEDADLKKSAS